MARWQTVRSASNATDHAVALEAPAGKRYARTVPDSLELSDRARLALSGIAGSIDEKLCHHMYFFVHWDCRTPYRIHHGADSTCDPLFAETLAMLRTMSGSEEHLDIESGQWADSRTPHAWRAPSWDTGSATVTRAPGRYGRCSTTAPLPGMSGCWSSSAAATSTR